MSDANEQCCIWGRCNGTAPRTGGNCSRCGTYIRARPLPKPKPEVES